MPDQNAVNDRFSFVAVRRDNRTCRRDQLRAVRRECERRNEVGMAVGHKELVVGAGVRVRTGGDSKLLA